MKNWLLAGKPKLGVVATIPQLAIAELIKSAGFDWVWIDAEHGGFNEISAATFCAINQSGPKTLVRIPDKTGTTLKRYLDIGADGIIIPQVNNIDEINEIMHWSLYPPAGERSVGIARAQGYGATLSSYITQRQYAIIIQIETKAGFHNLNEILRDDRIDGILVGPYDLSGSLGVMGQVSSPIVQDAIKEILSSCKQASIPCGIFAGNIDVANTYRDLGFDFIAIGVDASLLLESFKNIIKTTTE